MLDPHAANNNVPRPATEYRRRHSGAAGQVDHHELSGKRPRTHPYLCHPWSTRPRFSSSTRRLEAAKFTISGARCPSRATARLVHYYNLTPSKVTHSGKTGIQFWYRNFIVPSLGNQAPLVQALQLNGQIDHTQVVSATSAGLEPMVSQAVAARENRVYGPEQVVQTSQPEFSGTAAPGSLVKLSLSPATKPWDHSVTAGTTQADDTADSGRSPRLVRCMTDSIASIVSAFSCASAHPARVDRGTDAATGPNGRRGHEGHDPRLVSGSR